MHINFTTNPVKFHPDPIWNDGALYFFWKSRPNKKKNNDDSVMSSDVRSVADPKIGNKHLQISSPTIKNDLNYSFVPA